MTSTRLQDDILLLFDNLKLVEGQHFSKTGSERAVYE